MLLFLVGLVLSERSFKIVGNDFVMDGKPFRIIGGDFHYFRKRQAYWEDILKKLANMGLNTIQTFVPWNLHNPFPGVFNFEGDADLPHWLSLCQKYGLYVTLRAGPYMEGEWDFGGVPWWLTRYLTLREFRSSNPLYLKFVSEYLKVYLGKVKPFLYQNGGPIITVQVENEYGVYTGRTHVCDEKYMPILHGMFREILGNEIILTIVDPPDDIWVKCGGDHEHFFWSVDFGVDRDPVSAFQYQRRWNQGGPNINVEYYPGWIDFWGRPQSRIEAHKFANGLDRQLALNASVVMYIAVGGSSPGWMNGAGGDDNSYNPQPGNHDFDAPLSDWGDMRYKYELVREVIAKYRSDMPHYDVKNNTKVAYGKVQFTEGATLSDALPAITQIYQMNPQPLTFEALGQDYGIVLYRTHLSKGGTLDLGRVHDRATVILDGTVLAIIERHKEQTVTIPKAGVLDIMVHNQGRIDAGASWVQYKGLLNEVKLDGASVTPWEHHGFNLNVTSGIPFTTKLPESNPAFFRGTFEIEGEPEDTFLNPIGWGLGNAFINGYHLQKYWTIGPQLTIYIPKDLLVKGKNELIIFEHEKLRVDKWMTLDDQPQIDFHSEDSDE
jgi:beta-galactosidase